MKFQAFVSHGAVLMLGILCGALIAFQASGCDDARPDAGRHAIEFNGNPVNWSSVRGVRDVSGVVTWHLDEQVYSVPPEELRPSGRASNGRADRWVVVEINGRRVTIWGWVDSGVRWRFADQRTTALDAGDRLDAKRVDTRPHATPPVFTPTRDPSTGALSFGVDASKLKDDKVVVRASGPDIVAEVEDVRRFVANQPDQPDKAIDRSLPRVAGPNLFRWLFGVEFAVLALRACGVLLLATAVVIYFRNRSGS